MTTNEAVSDGPDTSCCLHVDSVAASPVIKLNSMTWKSIRVCAMKWLQLDVQEMKDIASRLVNGRNDLYNISRFSDASQLHRALSSYVCHLECYKRFTSQSSREYNNAGIFANSTKF